MKNVYTYLFSTLLLLGAAGGSVNAQVVAIGHATAEVVESISATSLAVTFLTLNTNNNTTDLVSSKSMSAQNLNLGEFKVSSAGAYIYNVILDENVTLNSKGNSLVVESSSNGRLLSDNQIVDSGKRVLLKGNVKIAEENITGNYSGTYKMVFAYN